MYLCYKDHFSNSHEITANNDLGLRLLPPPNRTLLDILGTLGSYDTEEEYEEAFKEKFKEYPNLFIIKDCYVGEAYSQLSTSVEYSHYPLFDTCISVFGGDFKDLKDSNMIKHAGFTSVYMNYLNYGLGYSCLDSVNLNNNKYQIKKDTNYYDIIVYENIIKPSNLHQSRYDNTETDHRRMVFTTVSTLGKENEENLRKIKEALGNNDGIQYFNIFYRDKRKLVDFKVYTNKYNLDTPDKANVLNGYIDKTLFLNNNSLELNKLIKSNFEILFNEEKQLEVELKFEGKIIPHRTLETMKFRAYINYITDTSKDPNNPEQYKSLVIRFKPALLEVGTYELTVLDLQYKVTYNEYTFPSAINDTFTWKFDIIETGNFTLLPQP